MHANDLLMNSSTASRQTEHNSEKLDDHMKKILGLALPWARVNWGCTDPLKIVSGK